MSDNGDFHRVYLAIGKFHVNWSLFEYELYRFTKIIYANCSTLTPAKFPDGIAGKIALLKDVRYHPDARPPSPAAEVGGPLDRWSEAICARKHFDATLKRVKWEHGTNDGLYTRQLLSTEGCIPKAIGMTDLANHVQRPRSTLGPQLIFSLFAAMLSRQVT